MAQIAGGGDGRLAAKSLGKPTRQLVRAVMASQQRHGDAAVLGQGQHGRLQGLVRQQRRQGADQHPGGTDADDGPALGEELPQMRSDLGEADCAARNPRGEAVQLTPDGAGGQLARGKGGGTENDDRRPHAFPCTRIMEKYGASPAAASRSGSTRWVSRLARSI